MRSFPLVVVLFLTMQLAGAVESRPFYGSPMIGANSNVLSRVEDYSNLEQVASGKDAFDQALLYKLSGDESHAASAAKLLKKEHLSRKGLAALSNLGTDEIIRILDASILVRGSRFWPAKDSAAFSRDIIKCLESMTSPDKKDVETKALYQLYLEQNDNARLTMLPLTFEKDEISISFATAAEKMGLNLWEYARLQSTGNNHDKIVEGILHPEIEGTVLSDKEFFTSVLDLGMKGLEAVRAATEDENWAIARKAFVSYLKTRDYPVWYFDWKDATKESVRDQGYVRTAADKAASNYLEAVHIPHQFGETVDWMANPTPDKYKEWTWHLSYHDWWNTLREAYWATGDEKYAEAFVKQMRSWIKQSPRPDFHARVEYSRWRSIETGIRMMDAWPNAFFGFLDSPSFDDDSIVEMVKSFYEHGLHLRAYYRSHNWLAKEMRGLFTIGIVFPEFKDSKEWMDFAAEKMKGEMKVQFYPEEGMSTELSPGYHIGSQRNICALFKLGSMNGYPFKDGQTDGLEKTYDVMLNAVMPDGLLPAHNDSGWSNGRGILSEGLDVFPQRNDWKYVATSGKEGERPDFLSSWMPWAGWYIMRSGWEKDDFYAFFDVGPYGAGHQHEDKLSLILSAYGSRLMTEGGTYAYDTSDWRKYVLSARAHNVSRVDGKDQNRKARIAEENIKVNPVAQKNRWVCTDGYEFGEGWYDEGFGDENDTNVTQYRALAYVKNRYWLIFDQFIPSDEESHRYDSWFHLNTPSYYLPEKLNGACGAEPDMANLAVLCFRPSAEMNLVLAQTEPEIQGWKSEQLTSVYECVPCATPTFSTTGTGKQTIPYLLYPIKPGEELPIKEIGMVEGRLEIIFKDGSKDIIDYRFGESRMEGLSINEEKVLPSEDENPEWDDTSKTIWPDGFEVVDIPSRADGSLQKAYIHKSSLKTAQPLIVVLHTWSGGYDQKDPLTETILQKDWNYIHPDFRGQNDSPQAMVSPLALSDIEDAIEFAVKETRADPNNVHIIGASGGGLATISSFMNISYPVRSFHAWAPITDLGAWFDESIGRDRKYYKDILSAIGKDNVMDYEEASRRSPLFQIFPSSRKNGAHLYIYEGVHDGYTGSVPITHSLLMYNRLVGELKYGTSDMDEIFNLSMADPNLVSPKEMMTLLVKRRNPKAEDKTLLGRQIHLEKHFSNIHLTIFEGKHEELPDALELLDTR